jgi:uncharacterized protein DUF4349
MSQPEHEAIVAEIRASRIPATPELRARVLAIAAVAPTGAADPPRRELPWRRLALVAVPACLAVALAISLAVGLSGSKQRSQAQSAAGSGGVTRGALAPKALESGAAPSAAPAGAALPATRGRSQLYEAELSLKVEDLSATTKRALRLTRDFHGFVRSIDYGSGGRSGAATMIVRIPVGSVQEAIVRFSALGEIVDQHVSIKDVQPKVDAQFRRMQAQRDLIAKIQAKLESPSLSKADRAALEERLVAARRALVLMQRTQAALGRQTSYATVSLDLATGKKQSVVPSNPGRIGRALHRSGQILADEAKVLVYVLIVGAPFIVLGAFAYGGMRVRRRRSEERLLSTS